MVQCIGNLSYHMFYADFHFVRQVILWGVSFCEADTRSSISLNVMLQLSLPIPPPSQFTTAHFKSQLGFLRLYSLPIPPFRNTAGFSPVPRTAVLGGTTVWIVWHPKWVSNAFKCSKMTHFRAFHGLILKFHRLILKFHDVLLIWSFSKQSTDATVVGTAINEITGFDDTAILRDVL